MLCSQGRSVGSPRSWWRRGDRVIDADVARAALTGAAATAIQGTAAAIAPRATLGAQGLTGVGYARRRLIDTEAVGARLTGAAATAIQGTAAAIAPRAALGAQGLTAGGYARWRRSHRRVDTEAVGARLTGAAATAIQRAAAAVAPHTALGAQGLTAGGYARRRRRRGGHRLIDTDVVRAQLAGAAGTAIQRAVAAVARRTALGAQGLTAGRRATRRRRNAHRLIHTSAARAQLAAATDAAIQRAVATIAPLTALRAQSLACGRCAGPGCHPRWGGELQGCESRGPNAPSAQPIVHVRRRSEPGAANDMATLFAAATHFDVVGSCGHVR